MSMKVAKVSSGPKVQIEDAPIPKAGPEEVLVKVEYCGSNPKDWKVFSLVPDTPPSNQCNDIAGFVEAVGEGVTEFRRGDRVAAFTTIAGGGYAEYAVAPACTTFFLPAKTSFKGGLRLILPAIEAAAIPLAALTAAVALYAADRLNLPQPTSPATESIPLVIYGGSSAVGTYAIQFAKKSNIHPIIAVAGKAQDHVQSMLDPSKGDVIVDYRKGDEAVVQEIKDALKGRKLLHAFDATAGSNSYINLVQALDLEHGRISLVLGPPHDYSSKYSDIPASIHQSKSDVFDVHGPLEDLGYVYCRYITRGLEKGWFRAQNQEECAGGLTGVEGALKKLKDGSASATKFVFRITDTPGIRGTK
ncbi:hypothetical protein NX059_005976 [Plenodomus lindquistii]|nr:hypothetical protein NX059_005976 [Plenodomus lindquistii]